MIRSPHITSSGGTPIGTAIQAQEIAELISLVLNSAFANADVAMPDMIALTPLNGGRSGAHVFKAVPSIARDPTRGIAPVVLKIGSRDAATAERANYERFVRPLLPVSCRPDLLGFAEARDRAVLCYSFLGDTDKPITLTGYLSAGDAGALDCALSTLVETLWECWYRPSLEPCGTDLARYYLDRYFANIAAASAAETALFKHASRYFGMQRCTAGYRLGEIVFPAIVPALFAAGGSRDHARCILHGDLNSDNILLNRDGSSARFVDFQRVGPGHALQDLVALEASVRINHPLPTAFGDILEIERRLALRRTVDRLPPYAKAIVKIRNTTMRLFGAAERRANHHFAIAAVGLRLMRANDLSHSARASIVASTLWAAKALVELDAAPPST